MYKPDSKDEGKQGKSLFGACTDGQRIYVGGDNGDILTFDSSLRPGAPLQKHAAPIRDLDFNEKLGILVSGDLEGGLHLWKKGKGSLVHLSSLKDFKESVTCLRVSRNGVACVGYLTGHLRMFNIATQALQVEITAHTRAISALAVHPTDNQVVCVGEDTCVSCWSIPTDTVKGVAHLLILRLNQSILTGAVYCGENSGHMAVTCFDSRFISVIEQPANPNSSK